jgi:hypothetical protein
MMASIRFGIMGFTIPPYEQLADRVRAVEAMGFSTAWVDDDLLMPGSNELEPWTLLAALARETSRIRLGTLVSVPPFRHPSLLAIQAVTVDHLSGGRAIVGFGAGGISNNNAAFGHDDWSPRERAERMEEQVAILAPLLRGDKVDYEGRHYRAHDARIHAARHLPHVPLIIAAHGDRGLRTTAMHADGWTSMGGQPYPHAQDPSKRRPLEDAVAETRRLSERLDEMCLGIGRGPASIWRSVLAYRPPFDPLSSVDAFDEFVGRYAEIGINEVIFYWPPLDNLFPKPTGTPGGYFSFEGTIPISHHQQRAFERIARDRVEASRWLP